MTNIIEKILREGTIPFLTDEGLKQAIIITATSKKGGVPETSRKVKLSTFKRSKEEAQLSPETEKAYQKEILKLLLQKIKADVKSLGLEGYKTILGKRDPILSTVSDEELNNLLNLINRNATIEEILEKSTFANDIYNYCAILQDDHTGKMNYIPYDLPKQKDHSLEYDYRIYFNPPDGETRAKFIVEYIKKCIARGIPYHMKGFEGSDEMGKIDKMIFYAHEEHLVDILEILEEIKNEQPELVSGFGSTITTALNYDYFAISQGVLKELLVGTYNDLAERISYTSLAITYAQFLLKTNKDALTDKDQEFVKNFSPKDAYVHENPYFLRRPFELREYFDESTLIALADNPEFISAFRENIQAIASYINFKDEKHQHMPICFKDRFYEYFGIDVEKKKRPEKTRVSFQEMEQLMFAKTNKLRSRLTLCGCPQSTTKDKSDDELRKMLFDRISLDDKTIIETLCGPDENLIKMLICYGATFEHVDDEPRDELEKMFIEFVGIDAIIEASEKVEELDKKSKRKRSRRYENSLQALRNARGKQIFQSEEFSSLDSQEKRDEYLETLSLYELEDLVQYCSLAKTLDAELMLDYLTHTLH